MELTDPLSIKAVCAAYKTDIVLHSAALSRPDECELDKEKAFATNVRATELLLQQASLNKSFFLFVSTDFVFDGQTGNYKEGDNTGPVNYYGQTKLLAEKLVQQYPYDWAIVRTILVYGKPLLPRPYLLNIVEEKLKAGIAYKVVNDQFRTPTYVEDLSAGIISIIEKKANGIFHIAGEDLLTPYEMAMQTAALLELNGSLLEPVTAATFSQPALRPAFTSFVLDKAKKQLGYQPRPFEEGLKKSFG
jgi:dTDP-4-dehydrorhamnose reductase